MKPTTLDILSAIPWGFKYQGTFTSLKLKLNAERAKVLVKRYPNAMVHTTKAKKVIIAWQEPITKPEYWNELLGTIKATRIVRQIKQLKLF